MPRTSSSTKTHIRALQAALDAEGLKVNYTQAHRVWDATTAAATGSPDPAVTTGPASGAALLEAIRALLSTMGAHVAADTPSLAPLDGDRARAEILPALGWEAQGDGCYEPRGPRVGTVTWDAKAGGWMVMFMPTAAFEEAARRHPHLIPADLSAAAAWTALWDDGLAAPTRSRRKRHGVPESTIRMRVGDQMMTGVPVLLSTLLSFGTPAAPPAAPATGTRRQWTAVDRDTLTWSPARHGHLLITGGSDVDRNLLQSRLSMTVQDADDVTVVRVAVLGDQIEAVLERHSSAVSSGTVPPDLLVLDVVKPVSDLPLSYDGAALYHRLKRLSVEGAKSNTFILARDAHPMEDGRARLDNVEHAVLGYPLRSEALALGVPDYDDVRWKTPGMAMTSYRP